MRLYSERILMYPDVFLRGCMGYDRIRRDTVRISDVSQETSQLFVLRIRWLALARPFGVARWKPTRSYVLYRIVILGCSGFAAFDVGKGLLPGC